MCVRYETNILIYDRKVVRSTREYKKIYIYIIFNYA